MLTTAIGFFAVAQLVADYVLTHLLPNSDSFNLLKYQQAKNFTAKSELTTSGAHHLLKEPDWHHKKNLAQEAHTVILRDCAKKREPPAEGRLLHVLLNFEHRLNLLDGHHPKVAESNHLKDEDQDEINKCLVSFGVEEVAGHGTTYRSSMVALRSEQGMDGNE